MMTVLYLVPVFALVSAVLVYRLNGRREFLRLDVVQFFYAFVLSPALFLWLKSFLYKLLRGEVPVALSNFQIFMIDTAFSIFFLYVFAFVVIHSLTKSFNLRRTTDPLYDLFEHSEFFHLWLTHLIMYVGAMLLISVLSIANVWFPLPVQLDRTGLYVICGLGVVSGLFSFMITWLSDPKQERANFMRLMKLSFGFFFLVHVVVYFVFNPAFSPMLGLYWWSLIVFATLVVCSLFAYRSERALSFFERVSEYFKHTKWGENIQLFTDARKKRNRKG
jgi:hypothetical protein